MSRVPRENIGKKFIEKIERENSPEVNFETLNLKSIKGVNPQNLTNEELNKVINKAIVEAGSAAKRMNQRLRQLEKSDLAKHSHVYNYIEILHFDKGEELLAKHNKERYYKANMLGTTKNNEIKFRTDINKMIEERLMELDLKNMSEKEYLKAKFKIIKEYGNFVERALTGKTSTTKGTSLMLYKMEEKFKQNFPDYDHLSYDEISEFFSNNKELLKMYYDSQGAIEVLKKSQEEGLSSDEIHEMLVQYDKDRQALAKAGGKNPTPDEGSQLDRADAMIRNFKQVQNQDFNSLTIEKELNNKMYDAIKKERIKQIEKNLKM